MVKKLFCKNEPQGGLKKRFVFENIEKPTGSGSGTAAVPTPGLREQFDEKLKADRERLGKLHATTLFKDKPQEVFEELAKQLQEIDSSITAATLLEDFVKTLNEHETLASAWEYLKSNKCKTAAIMAGLLEFFADDKAKISISELLKPDRLEIGGPNTLTNHYLSMRNSFLQQSMKLMAALKANLPETPPTKTS